MVPPAGCCPVQLPCSRAVKNYFLFIQHNVLPKQTAALPETGDLHSWALSLVNCDQYVAVSVAMPMHVFLEQLTRCFADPPRSDIAGPRAAILAVLV